MLLVKFNLEKKILTQKKKKISGSQAALMGSSTRTTVSSMSGNEGERSRGLHCLSWGDSLYVYI